MAKYISLAFVALAAAQKIIAPSATSSILPRATDSRFGGFISDGGAGGFVPQWNLSIFSISDGAICAAAHFDKFSSSDCSYPVHTAYTGIDYSDPSKLVVIGKLQYSSSSLRSNYQPGSGTFYTGSGGEGLVPYIAAVDNKAGIKSALNFGPAPHVAPISIPGNSTGLLNVWPVHNAQGAVAPYVFNTMFEMNFIGDANYLDDFYKIQVPTQRTAPLLFNVSAGITGYGSAMLTSGRGSEANTHFYLWEGDKTGWKLARAPWASRTDTTTYDYWHGAAGWVRNAPLRANTDSFGNVYNFTNFANNNQNTGIGIWGQDIRWVDRFQTYVITFQPQPGYDLFMQYSLTGAITGPYSNPVSLVQAPLDSQCQKASAGDNTILLTDFIQVHWDYYGLNAPRALYSWISCTTFQNMGVIEWTTGYNNYPSPAQSYKGN